MSINPIPIIILAPIIGGFLAWLINIKGIREIIGVISDAIPLGYLAYL